MTAADTHLCRAAPKSCRRIRRKHYIQPELRRVLCPYPKRCRRYALVPDVGRVGGQVHRKRRSLFFGSQASRSRSARSSSRRSQALRASTAAPRAISRAPALPPDSSAQYATARNVGAAAVAVGTRCSASAVRPLRSGGGAHTGQAGAAAQVGRRRGTVRQHGTGSHGRRRRYRTGCGNPAVRSRGNDAC